MVVIISFTAIISFILKKLLKVRLTIFCNAIEDVKPQIILLYIRKVWNLFRLQKSWKSDHLEKLQNVPLFSISVEIALLGHANQACFLFNNNCPWKRKFSPEDTLENSGRVK